MVIIEIYLAYEEIYFLDEFYVWNNEKNGGIYSWFDKGKDDAELEYQGESQVKLGVIVAISNKGRCYYNIVRKPYDQFLFTYFLFKIFEELPNNTTPIEKVVFFLDNAGIHHSILVKQVLINWDISMIFNTIKSPFYNPAELVISHIKSNVRIQYYFDEYELIEGLVSAF